MGEGVAEVADVRHVTKLSHMRRLGINEPALAFEKRCQVYLPRGFRLEVMEGARDSAIPTRHCSFHFLTHVP